MVRCKDFSPARCLSADFSEPYVLRWRRWSGVSRAGGGLFGFNFGCGYAALSDAASFLGLSRIHGGAVGKKKTRLAQHQARSIHSPQSVHSKRPECSVRPCGGRDHVKQRSTLGTERMPSALRLGHLKLNVVIQIELVGVGTQGHLFGLTFPLVVEPGFDDILGKHVALEQELVIGFEGV